jgi:hypothetical protein
VRSRRASLAALLLLAIGAILTGANVWCAAVRSTIPLHLDGVVTTAEMRREKHPGKDDIFLLKLSGRPAFQVDASVFQAVSVGERLHKTTWSRQLHHGTGVFDLTWSHDLRGMLGAMPAVLMILLATCLAAFWQ